jgi:HK97 family phage portal protein
MKLWGSAQDIGDPVHAGVLVSQETALRLTTVYRCIRLISESIASMPVDVFRKQGEARIPVDRPPSWLEIPNPESTPFELYERITESLAMDGNAFVVVTARDFQGFPAEIWTLNPRQIVVKWQNGRTIYEWSGTDPITRLTRFGPRNPMGDVLHIKLASAGGHRGLSPLELAKQSIGLGLVTEKFGSKFFGRGQTMSGVIELPPAEANRSREHIDLMRETWEEAHAGSDRAHRPGILTGGAQWKQLTIPPEQAQFIETRKFQVEEICRIFGVPPHMVGHTEKSTSWGTGIEQQSLGFVRFVLMPWLVRIEQAMSQLIPRGQYFKFNQRSLLRADMKGEAEALVKLVTNRLMTPDEARSHMELPPSPGGDKFLMPLNLQTLTPGGDIVPETPAELVGGEE